MIPAFELTQFSIVGLAAPVLVVIFVSGGIRMYRPTLEDVGVVRFLAFGHPFDPFMGVLKMLVSFG